MANLYNDQRVLGIRLVADGTVMFNNQLVIGIVDAGFNLFVGNLRTIGVDVLPADAAVYNDRPVLGAVLIADGRKLYNNMLVIPAHGNLAPNLLIAGAWDAHVTGGTATATESPAGQLNLHGDAAANAARASQSITTAIGTTYRLTADVAGSAVNVNIGTTKDGGEVFGSFFNVGLAQTLTFVATATTTWINFDRAADVAITITNISCIQQ